MLAHFVITIPASVMWFPVVSLEFLVVSLEIFLSLEFLVMSRNVHWFSGHGELHRKLDVCLNRIYIFLRHSDDTKQM